MEAKSELYPLHVVFLVRQERGHVVHDLDAPPIRVHRVQTGEVVRGVQAALVLVETFQPYFIAEYLQELVEQRRVLVVVQHLLLGALVLLNVQHTDFQFRFYEHLIQLQQLVLSVRQLT